MTTPNNTGAVTALRALIHAEIKHITRGCDDLKSGDESMTERLVAALLPLLASPPEDAPAVDGGDAEWVLVPREPTDAMCDAIEYGGARPICETRRDDRRYFLRKALAAAPAPAEAHTAVEREACRTCFGVGNFDTRGAPVCPDCNGTGRTPPSEAREPVGVTDARVERGVAWYFGGQEPHTDAMRNMVRAFLSAALAQPRDTPRDSGDAVEVGHLAREVHYELVGDGLVPAKTGGRVRPAIMRALTAALAQPQATPRDSGDAKRTPTCHKCRRTVHEVGRVVRANPVGEMPALWECPGPCAAMQSTTGEPSNG